VTDVGHTLDDLALNTLPGWQIQPVNTPAGLLGTLAVQFSDDELTSAYRKTRNLALFVAITGMIIIAGRPGYRLRADPAPDNCHRGCAPFCRRGSYIAQPDWRQGRGRAARQQRKQHGQRHR